MSTVGISHLPSKSFDDAPKPGSGDYTAEGKRRSLGRTIVTRGSCLGNTKRHNIIIYLAMSSVAPEKGGSSAWVRTAQRGTFLI